MKMKAEYKCTDIVSEIIFQIVRISYNQEKIDFLSFDYNLDIEWSSCSDNLNILSFSGIQSCSRKV